MMEESQKKGPEVTVIPLKHGFFVRQTGDCPRNIDYFDRLDDLLTVYPKADMRKI